MLVRLRRAPLQGGVAVLQLLTFGFALHLGTRPGMLAGAIVLLVITFPAWLSALLRLRGMSHTPTSRVASAAQGYVELQGRGRAPAGLPLLAPLTGLPCLWYRFRVERRDGNKWVLESSGESDASFVLDDGSGQCLVDPEQAEILVRRHDSWRSGDRRRQQWLLIENDPLYVLGQFFTRGSVDVDIDINAETRALLADWKKDKPHLLRRFDLNRDGEIDLAEWGLARAQARREATAIHRAALTQAELHIMRRPDDARLYLISSLPPARIARRYRMWAAFHGAVFLLAMAGLGYAWGLPS